MSINLFLQLGKFRLSLLVLFTTAIGYGLAVETFNGLLVICLLFGTLLCAMGANGLNQWWERDRDARMKRTRQRPLPSGKMSSSVAFSVALAWSLGGLGILYFGVNWLTAYLAFITLITYLFIYTPLKVHSSIAVLVGAIPGAIPPIMGWTAVTGEISTQAWILGCILYLWQIPHFMSLAAMYQEDYAQGGYELLPDNPPKDQATRSIILVYSIALLGISLLAPLAGLGASLFAAGALISGGILLFLCGKLYRDFSTVNARNVFLCSVLYLPLMMTLLLLDQRLFTQFYAI